MEQIKDEKTPYQLKMEKLKPLTGNISKVFASHSLIELRAGIWDWFCLVIEKPSSLSNEEQKKINGLHKVIKQLMDDVHSLLITYQHGNYKPEEFGNILRRTKFLDRKEAKNGWMTSLEKLKETHIGEFQFLEYNESFNPYLFFERFFGHADIKKWKETIKSWKKGTIKSLPVIELTSSVKVTETYVLIQQLIESCHLFNKVVFSWSFHDNGPLKLFSLYGRQPPT